MIARQRVSGDRATGTAAVPQALLEEILRIRPGSTSTFTTPTSGRSDRGQVVVSLTPRRCTSIVGHVDGLNNTRFVADARVVNRSGGTSTAFGVLSQLARRAVGVLGNARRQPGRGRGEGRQRPRQLAVLDHRPRRSEIGVADAMTTGVRVFNDLGHPMAGRPASSFDRRGSRAATGGPTVPPQASNEAIQTGDGFRSSIRWFNQNPSPQARPSRRTGLPTGRLSVP